MKVRIPLIIFFISILLFLSGCSGNPNEKANKLYTEASQILQNSKLEDDSYSDVYNSYENAKSRIDRILSKYPSSNIAVELLSGDMEISGLTLSQFHELESSLKLLAEAEQSPFSCALLVANKMQYPQQQASVLVEIAGKYAKAGQKEQADQLLSQALQSTDTIKDDTTRQAMIWSEVAGMFAMLGQTEEADKVISHALQSKLGTANQVLVLTKTAGKYAEAGQKEQADQLLSQALQIANTSNYTETKVRLLIEIAGTYAKAEQKEQVDKLLSEALQATNTFSSAEKKAPFLVEIAGIYAETDQFEQATQLLSQAFQTTNMIGIEYVTNKDWTLAKIADIYANLEQFSQALQTTNAIADADFKTKANALVMIASGYAKAGQFSQAIQMANTIELADYRVRALVEIAGQYIETGQKEQAIHLLSQALQIVNAFDSAEAGGIQASLLVDIASRYAEAGEFSQAIQTANTIEKANSKTLALAKIVGEIAGKYAQTQEQPTEKDKSSLRKITHSISPMNQFWK